MFNPKKSLWKEVSVEILGQVHHACVDLFYKLNDYKFIKVYQKNDDSLSSTVDSYKTKHVKNLFCRKSDYQDLVEQLLLNNIEISNFVLTSDFDWFVEKSTRIATKSATKLSDSIEAQAGVNGSKLKGNFKSRKTKSDSSESDMHDEAKFALVICVLGHVDLFLLILLMLVCWQKNELFALAGQP